MKDNVKATRNEGVALSRTCGMTATVLCHNNRFVQLIYRLEDDVEAFRNAGVASRTCGITADDLCQNERFVELTDHLLKLPAFALVLAKSASLPFQAQYTQSAADPYLSKPKMYSSVVVPCAMSRRYKHGYSRKQIEQISRDDLLVTILLVGLAMQLYFADNCMQQEIIDEG